MSPSVVTTGYGGDNFAAELELPSLFQVIFKGRNLCHGLPKPDFGSVFCRKMPYFPYS